MARSLHVDHDDESFRDDVDYRRRMSMALDNNTFNESGVNSTHGGQGSHNRNKKAKRKTASWLQRGSGSKTQNDKGGSFIGHKYYQNVF